MTWRRETAGARTSARRTPLGVCYLLVPLLVGHGYPLLIDFAAVDCPVLLLAGGLLFL